MKKFRLQFGGKMTRDLKVKYQQSNNWKDGNFQNLEKTQLDISLWKIPAVIYKQLSSKPGKEPDAPLPILPFDEKAFLAPHDKAKFIWYGHSVVMIRLNGKTLIIDPMLGPDTTPIAPIPTKRFSENTLSLIDDFPDIDVVLYTHDHYDHLDFDSVQKLKHKTKQFFVAMGVKRHLVRWGVDANKITEFDWWDKKVFENINITFTPTRHFSGRGLTDRTKSLWGGWAFKTNNESIWFSGDGGYGNHFKTIGEQLGPFDFAFMECGQYNDDWHSVHLFPEESILAAIDGRAKKIMPVHWAGFFLSYQHTWTEPADEFIKFAKQKKIDYLIPPLGKQFHSTDILIDKWWKQ